MNLEWWSKINMNDSNDYLRFVRDYYREKISTFGPTPQGVDWNGIESQTLRFELQYELAKSQRSGFRNILDFGCGYGEFATFLLKQRFSGEYTGFDLVQDSIEIARKSFQAESNVRFETELDSKDYFDILFASGVFNVSYGSHQDWLSMHVKDTLKFMVSFSDTLVLNFLKPNPTRASVNLFFPSKDEIESVLPEGFELKMLIDDYNLWEWTTIIERSGI